MNFLYKEFGGEQLLSAINVIAEYTEACAVLDVEPTVNGLRRTLLHACVEDIVADRKKEEAK